MFGSAKKLYKVKMCKVDTLDNVQLAISNNAVTCANLANLCNNQSIQVKINTNAHIPNFN